MRERRQISDGHAQPVDNIARHDHAELLRWRPRNAPSPAPTVRRYLVMVGSRDGAAMAPLGEWSLEATVLDGARGMPGTVASLNGAP